MSEAYWIKKIEGKPNFKLGQNSLIDTNISRKITKLVQGQLADPIIEIGPGTGSLTNELLKDNYRLRVLEIDKNLAAITEERFSEIPNIEVITQDAMEYDYSKLTGPWWILVSNLPYYIGTRLLVKLITEVPVIHRYVVMVQKEVAERITAQPNTKEYGALSVVCSLFTNPKLQFDVSKNCFTPVPKVTSSVVTLQRERLIDEEERLEAFNLSKIAFQQKRKKIKSALQEYFSVAELEKLGINPDDRPQKLTPEQYLLLAKSLK